MSSDQSNDKVPAFIADWFGTLSPQSLDELTTTPETVALFSADLTIGFCRTGALASPRVGALAEPARHLFLRAHALGVRHFVLLQDTHDPATPEFQTWPPHCMRGTDEARTIPELTTLPFANQITTIEKNSLNPAIATEFDDWLDAHPWLTTAIVLGDCTDLCVYQLAMHLRLRANARNLPRFEVIVAADVVDTFNLPVSSVAGSAGLPHPGDFFHRVFLYHLALNGVRVVQSLT